MTSFRFNMTADTLPTHWTFPNTGWNDGAQVLNGSRSFDILEEGEDRQDDWFTPRKYPYLFIIKHSGANGHSRMGYKAITEENVEEVYRIDREMAEWIVQQELADDDDAVDNFGDILMEEAEKINVSWVDPR